VHSWPCLHTILWFRTHQEMKILHKHAYLLPPEFPNATLTIQNKLI
jgi:hypothetical protein